MSNKRSNVVVQTFQLPGMLIEKYFYSAGTVEPLPKHSHHEYQLGMSFNCQGEYYYRGAYHPIPIGKLSIIHSGEVHSPSERTYLPDPATFLMMHLDPSLLEKVALEMVQQPTNLPFFTEPVLHDLALGKLFQNLCFATETKTSKLEQDALTVDFLSSLIGYQTTIVPKAYSVKPAIALVCDYLQANYQKNISLAELSEISGLSRFYLSRLFRRHIGLSLSAYQRQVRIDRAKKLLAIGKPIAYVALSTGFYDQSHFTGHFKRLVGTTPAKYQQQQ